MATKIPNKIWKLRNKDTGLFWGNDSSWRSYGKAYCRKGDATRAVHYHNVLQKGNVELVEYEIIENEKAIIPIDNSWRIKKEMADNISSLKDHLSYAKRRKKDSTEEILRLDQQIKDAEKELKRLEDKYC